MRRRLFAFDNQATALNLNNLAFLLQGRGEVAEAEPLFREAVGMNERMLGKEHRHTAGARLGLGRTLTGLKRFAEAEPELIEAQRAFSNAQGVPLNALKGSIAALVTLYESWDKAEPGKGYDARAAEWRAKLEAAN